jgi:hypothetical protein
MLGALISVQTQTELLDAAQALKLGRVDQAHHQLAFVSVRAKANDVMNRISIYTFSHHLCVCD